MRQQGEALPRSSFQRTCCPATGRGGRWSAPSVSGLSYRELLHLRSHPLQNSSHLIIAQGSNMKVQPSQIDQEQIWWAKLTVDLHNWLAKALSDLHWSLDSSSAQFCCCPSLHKCWSLLIIYIISSISVFASRKPNMP